MTDKSKETAVDLPTVTERQRKAQAQKLRAVIAVLEVAVLETKSATPDELSQSIAAAIATLSGVNDFLATRWQGPLSSDGPVAFLPETNSNGLTFFGAEPLADLVGDLPPRPSANLSIRGREG